MTIKTATGEALASAEIPTDPRSAKQAVWRGIRHRCPACGKGRLFRAFLKVNDACPQCGEELHHQRADDAPPYITIFLVGHIVVPLVLIVEQTWHPEEWVHAVLWAPLTLLLTLAILPSAKGALIGLQWALRMHGFGGEGSDVPVLETATRPSA